MLKRSLRDPDGRPAMLTRVIAAAVALGMLVLAAPVLIGVLQFALGGLF
jgi:hypothetical protein